MGIMARLIPGPALEERYAARTMVRIDATVRADSGTDGHVTLLDISTDGFRMRGGRDCPIGTRFCLELPSLARLSAMIVWREGELHGCRFDTPLSMMQIREITGGHDWQMAN